MVIIVRFVGSDRRMARSESRRECDFCSSQAQLWKVECRVEPESGPGVNNLYGVSAAATNDVWAVGDDDVSMANTVGFSPLSEHWDCSQWRVVPSQDAPGASASILYSVSATSRTDAWAAGYSTRPSGGSFTYIEHWDGSQWKITPSPGPGQAGSKLYGISALSSSNVWAVGYYATPGGDGGTLIEQWDGSQWHIVPSPNAPGSYTNILYSIWQRLAPMFGLPGMISFPVVVLLP